MNAGTRPMRHGELPVPEDLVRAPASKLSLIHFSPTDPLFCCCPRRRLDVTPLPNTGRTVLSSTYLILITKEIGALTKPLSHQWNVPPVVSPACLVYATVVPLAPPTAGYHLETKPSFLLARRITRLSVSICSQGIDLNFTSCSSASTLLVLCI